MTVDAEPIVNRRLELSVYLCGLFSNSMSNIIAVILPLWLVTLEPSAFMIGLVLGSRTFLPLLLSIHGGSVIDRVGARRVIFWSGIVLTAVTLLYPSTTWLPVIIFIQMVAGLAATMGWIGAQTLIGQRMKGDPTYAGRLAFSTRCGILIGPPAAGAVWDLAGPFAAFMFAAIWACGVVLGVLLLPHRATEGTARRTPSGWRALVPNLGDYLAAFRLMALPAVLLVVLVSVIRVAGEAVNASFYVVYLDSAGYSGTAIGFLVSAFSVPAAFSALFAGRIAAYFNPFWLLVAAVAAAVVLICITPLLGSYLLLMIAMLARGAVSGMVQPLMLSIVSRATDRQQQGLAVGLRATSNRLAMTFTPILMGAVAEVVGIANSFYVVGVVLVVMLLAIAWYVKSTPDFKSAA
ncbi:MAG: hypothetical protein RLZ98_2526 [Pseudomonadota bacterium]